MASVRVKARGKHRESPRCAPGTLLNRCRLHKTKKHTVTQERRKRRRLRQGNKPWQWCVTSSAAGSAAGGWGSLGPSSRPTSGDVVGGAGPPRAASARWSAARAGSAAARCARPVALAWPSQPQPQAGGAGRGVLAPAGVALQPTRRHRVALRFEYSSSRLGSGAGLRHRPAVVAGLPSTLATPPPRRRAALHPGPPDARQPVPVQNKWEPHQARLHLQLSRCEPGSSCLASSS